MTSNKVIVSKSLLNIKVALLLFILNLILSFISRKFFLKYLGIELVGLNTIIGNIIGFLNLAELGIVTAISYALYKPLRERDYSEINNILSVQGWLYRNVGFFIICCSIIILFFFPVIFAKSKLPLIYAYFSFIVLLLSSLMSYFFSYIQVLLIADLQEYKVNLCIQIGKFLKLLVQIAAVSIYSSPFIIWLIVELLFNLIVAYLLYHLVHREYPWLNISPLHGKKIRKNYDVIITKVKQLFFHKFAGIILLQTSPIIVYSYMDLRMVAKYDNYMLIVVGIISLTTTVFSTLQPAIGSFIAKSDKYSVMKLLNEYTAIRFWFVSLLSFLFYFNSNIFIEIWLGKQYLLENIVVFWLTIYMFLNLSRVSEPFTNAYGLFSDIHMPIIELILNLTASILLGYFFGLPGIIAGVSLSLFIVVFIWKPYFLYSKGFEEKVNLYFLYIIQIIILILISFYLSYKFISFLDIKLKNTGFLLLIFQVIIYGFVYVVFSVPLFFLNSNFRYAILRSKIFFQ